MTQNTVILAARILPMEGSRIVRLADRLRLMGSKRGRKAQRCRFVAPASRYCRDPLPNRSRAAGENRAALPRRVAKDPGKILDRSSSYS